jgi:hypothetical protein
MLLFTVHCALCDVQCVLKGDILPPGMADSVTPMRRLPYARAWSIAARTIHIASTSYLLGAYAFEAASVTLTPCFLLAGASGLVLVAIEAYSHPHWADQLWFLAVLLKTLLLCVLPLTAAPRVPVVLLVLVLGSVGSHAPRSLRHYSVLLGGAEY